MGVGAVVVAFAAMGLGTWPMHVIDRTTQGADGVRLADMNKDGLPDIVTGWEEGGDIRVAINPGPKDVSQEWKSFSVGAVADPEDAVMVDIDGDGWLDVVSCTEGKDKTVYVHWNPGATSLAPAPGLDSLITQWKPRAVRALEGKAAWMFCLPMPISNRSRPDLVIGAKDPNGEIGWLKTSGGSRRAESWRWHKLRTAGWIMSLIAEDMDGDGDVDVLFSDRKGPAAGVYWLERTSKLDAWPEHAIGLAGREVMFISTGDFDHDGDRDVAAAVKPRNIVLFLREDAEGKSWKRETVTYSEKFGTSKAVRIADVDGDGAQDLIASCEQSETTSGVFWLSRNADGTWAEHDIAGDLGIKYDLIEPVDLDGDGDLDVITCEEREINAVIWYENPVSSAGDASGK